MNMTLEKNANLLKNEEKPLKKATKMTTKTVVKKNLKPITKDSEKAIEKAIEKKIEPVKTSTKNVKLKKNEVKKGSIDTKICVQFNGKDYSTQDLMKMAKDVWVYDCEKKGTELKSAELYVKPEEDKVYYVFNGELSGSFII